MTRVMEFTLLLKSIDRNFLGSITVLPPALTKAAASSTPSLSALGTPWSLADALLTEVSCGSGRNQSVASPLTDLQPLMMSLDTVTCLTPVLFVLPFRDSLQPVGESSAVLPYVQQPYHESEWLSNAIFICI